jgi:DMSO/TMAO reductase YedYZ molybdopterin-dependent catalytic subunit
MIDRRAFLRLGAVAGAASLSTACGWDGGGAVKPSLLSLSRLNDWVGEHLLFSPSRLARTYDISERSAGLPGYFISNTVPMLKDPAAWRLSVGGLVRTPLTLSLDDIQRMPSVTYTVKHHCVEGWSAIATWTGVPVSAIAERCGMTPAAQ